MQVEMEGMGPVTSVMGPLQVPSSPRKNTTPFEKGLQDTVQWECKETGLNPVYRCGFHQ